MMLKTSLLRLPYAFLLVGALCLTGCDNKGYQRSQAIYNAETNGADWIITQDNQERVVVRCWILHNVSVANEEHSDGIHWLDNHNRLIHISGGYNRIMVDKGNWDDAAEQLDVKNLNMCHSG